MKTLNHCYRVHTDTPLNMDTLSQKCTVMDTDEVLELLVLSEILEVTVPAELASDCL